MKTTLAILICVILTLGLFSCKDDSTSSNNTTKTLVGKWYGTGDVQQVTIRFATYALHLDMIETLGKITTNPLNLNGSYFQYEVISVKKDSSNIVATATVSGDSVFITVPLVNATYKGKFADDGKSINGFMNIPQFPESIPALGGTSVSGNLVLYKQN